jgi:hypothetical protein
MRILEPRLRGLLHDPILRLAQVWRACQPRSVHVGEHVQRAHDLRPLGRLAPDLPDHVSVDALDRLWRGVLLLRG